MLPSLSSSTPAPPPLARPPRSSCARLRPRSLATSFDARALVSPAFHASFSLAELDKCKRPSSESAPVCLSACCCPPVCLSACCSAPHPVNLHRDRAACAGSHALPSRETPALPSPPAIVSSSLRPTTAGTRKFGTMRYRPSATCVSQVYSLFRHDPRSRRPILRLPAPQRSHIRVNTRPYSSRWPNK